MTTSLETVPIMEALLLNCTAGVNLSLLLNNIWTWLAVMTAAVGFWRIRSLKPDPVSIPEPPAYSPPVRLVQDRSAPEPDRTASTSSRLDDETTVTSPTKGNKYRAFYSYCMQEEEENDGVLGGWVGGGAEAEVVEELRRRSSSPLPAAGWYRYQDRRVLDGSVVKLWDLSSSSSSSTKTTTILSRYLPLGL